MNGKKIIKYNPIDSNGKKIDAVYELKLTILEDSGNYLIHKNIVKQHIKKQRIASTKTRSEVRGGGKKPWKQKGTGKARAGSSRSPLWKGGGVIFGPKIRMKNFKLNKKERSLALQTLFYNKKNNIVLLQDLETIFNIPKTKNFLKICKNCDIKTNQKILVIVSKKLNTLKLSIKNIKNIELISASHLNTLSLIKAKQIILTPLALSEIKEIFYE